MNLKKEIFVLIGLGIIAVLVLAGGIYNIYNNKSKATLNESESNDLGKIYFSNATLTSGYLMMQNYTPKLIIHCKPYSSSDLNEPSDIYQDSYVIMWMYSQCAMIEANPMMFAKSLKKYHVCFILENKSIGDCN